MCDFFSCLVALRNVHQKILMCDFFSWSLRLLARGVFPVIVVLIVSLFGNWNVGPSMVFLIFVGIVMSSVSQ